MTPIGALSSPATMALRMRAQNACPSQSKRSSKVIGFRHPLAVPRLNTAKPSAGEPTASPCHPRTVFLDGIVRAVETWLRLGPHLPLKEEGPTPVRPRSLSPGRGPHRCVTNIVSEELP